MLTSTVFSEYEVREIGVIIGEEKASIVCVGQAEEEMEVQTVTKKCRGKVAKTRTRGTGNGTVTVSAHMPYDLFHEMFNFRNEGLKKGIYAYGENSLHKVFTMTERIFDEDGNEKLKAYPKCSIQTGISRTVENGADEVTETEVEIAVMPDDFGEGFYEVLVDSLDPKDKETIISKWMTEFSRELITETD